MAKKYISNNPARYCTWCDTELVFKACGYKPSIKLRDIAQKIPTPIWIYRCPNCGQMLTLREKINSFDPDPPQAE